MKEFKRSSLELDNSSFIDIDDSNAVRTIEEGRLFLLYYLQEQYEGLPIEQIKEDTQKRTENIRYLRTNTKLSQRAVAFILGIDKSVVEKIKAV